MPLQTGNEETFSVGDFGDDITLDINGDVSGADTLEIEVLREDPATGLLSLIQTLTATSPSTNKIKAATVSPSPFTAAGTYRLRSKVTWTDVEKHGDPYEIFIKP